MYINKVPAIYQSVMRKLYLNVCTYVLKMNTYVLCTILLLSRHFGQSMGRWFCRETLLYIIFGLRYAKNVTKNKNKLCI